MYRCVLNFFFFLFSVKVKVVAEVRDRDHGDELKAALGSKYGSEFLWGADYNIHSR